MRCLIFLVFVCVFSHAQAQSGKFNVLLNAYYQDFLALNPSVATSVGDNRYNDRLENDESQFQRDTQKNLYRQYLASLQQIDRKTLSDAEQLSYDILQYDLSKKIELLALDSHLEPVNQMGDYRLSFSQMGGGSGDHPFKTVKDYEDFLKRIKAFVEANDSAIANMKKAISMQRLQPRIIIERVIQQTKSMLVDSVSKSLFYAPVKKLPAHFSDAEKTRLTAAYSEAISARLMPAYKKMLDFLQNDYLPQARSTHGISAQPGGKDRYAILVKYYTSTDLTPDEVFEIGEREVKRIRNEMEKIKVKTGFKGGMPAFFSHLFADPKFFPFQTEEDVVAGYNKIYDKMKPHLLRQFNLVPKTPFEVRPVEKYRAATAAAHYMRGTSDGTRPGIFYFPVLNAKKYAYWRMENLFLHEAIPGHHYQLSLQLENTAIPDFRKIGGYGAYIEGWGLYAESLGKQLGLYTDPYQQLGQLYGEIHRAIRLVVDAGIHYKGWTRDEAVQYSLDNEPTTKERAIQEIERYIAWPGQALSYKIGELKIKEIREKAENKLKNKFKATSFHDEVLKDGSMPLKIFEMKMNKWIDQQSAKK